MPKQTVKWNQEVQGLIQFRDGLLNSTYAYNIFSDAGTINGLTCTASTSAVLSDRRQFKSLSSANNANNVVQIVFNLPPEYVAGRDIVVRFCFTYLSWTGWAIRWGVGITQASNGWNPYGWDTYATFQETTRTAPVHTGYDVEHIDTVFSGTWYAPGDQISLIIYRNTTTGNPDTLATTVYLAQAWIMTT